MPLKLIIATGGVAPASVNGLATNEIPPVHAAIKNSTAVLIA